MQGLGSPLRAPAAVEMAPLIEVAARLGRTLAVARGLVLAGRRVELTGVDDGIGLLCAKTLDLVAPDGRPMLPHLYELLSQVDRLMLALRENPPQA